MRKPKAYFGQNRCKHVSGWSREKQKMVVPRLLHYYFSLQRMCRQAEFAAKLSINSTVGACAPNVEPLFQELLTKRRAFKKAVMDGTSVANMEDLLVNLETRRTVSCK